LEDIEMQRKLRVIKRSLAEALPLVLALLMCSMSFKAQGEVNPVLKWNNVGGAAAANAGRGPATFIDLTYMHIAVYDAVSAIDGEHRAFGSRPWVQGPTSKEAAAAAAAYNVLRILYPTQQAMLDQRYSESLATIPEGAEKFAGVQVGTAAAAQYMAIRTGDGRNAPGAYSPGSGPGAWIPTPPGNLPGAFPWLARMRPFAIDSPSQFRGEGPPPLDSAQWAEEYNEVKRLGGIQSVDRTPAQTEAGLFYVEGAAGQSARAFRRLAIEHRLDTAESARLFAMIYVSISDSLITTWDSKYYYAFWRPVTAIRAGDTDGNPGTEPDPTWTPLAVTPNFPEYVSAHSSVAAGFSEAISSYFGTKTVTVTLDSTVTGTSRTFHNTDDIIKDVGDARIYAGFHFRSACVHGGVIGKKVGRFVAKHYFQPI
jgi:hypothetical protein